MNWLKQLVKSNPLLSICIPAFMSSLTFFGNLIASLADGQIDDVEFHNLMSTANGIEMIVLMIIIIALREKKQ